MRAISSRSPVAEILAFVEANLELNPGNLVQFNHPSSHHFTLLEEGDATRVEALLAEYRARHGAGRRSTVYAAFPFCIPTQPKDCGFCPFPKVDLGEGSAGGPRSTAIAAYLQRFERELERAAPHLGLPLVADAVYFGGGTPNLLRADEAHAFVRRMLAAFPPRAGAEVTFEGIPYLFTRAEKVAALQAAGVTRCSIGAQQLKDHLIKLSGRSTQTRRTVEQSVALMQEHGLDHSVDLIFGWPQQTYEDALDDIAMVIAWRVPHVTVYPLNQPKGIAFSSAPYVDQIVSVRERVRMYRGIRDLLLERGYRQVTMSDYQLVDRSHFDYENFTHDPLNTDMRAIGYSGFSRCAGSAAEPGFTWIAPHELGEYYRQVDSGRMPLRAYFRFTAADVELSWLLNQLQEMSVPLARYREAFGKDLLVEQSSLWEALERIGWVAIADDTLYLCGDGVFYTALIQRLLAFDRDQELRQHRTMIGYRASGRFLPTVIGILNSQRSTAARCAAPHLVRTSGRGSPALDGGTTTAVRSLPAGGLRAVEATEQFVEDELVGPLGGAQHPVDVQVGEAGGQLRYGHRQLPGLVEPAQFPDQRGQLPRPLAQCGTSGRRRRRRVCGRVDQPLQGGALLTESGADFAAEGAVDVELAAEPPLGRPGQPPLVLEGEAEVVEQRVDAAQRQPPAPLLPGIPSQRPHDGQRRRTVGGKDLFGQLDGGRAAVAFHLPLIGIQLHPPHLADLQKRGERGVQCGQHVAV